MRIEDTRVVFDDAIGPLLRSESIEATDGDYKLIVSVLLQCGGRIAEMAGAAYVKPTDSEDEVRQSAARFKASLATSVHEAFTEDKWIIPGYDYRKKRGVG